MPVLYLLSLGWEQRNGIILRMLTKKDGRDAEYIPPILVPSGDAYLSSR
jgi:hypothetical protein